MSQNEGQDQGDGFVDALSVVAVVLLPVHSM